MYTNSKLSQLLFNPTAIFLGGRTAAGMFKRGARSNWRAVAEEFAACHITGNKFWLRVRAWEFGFPTPTDTWWVCPRDQLSHLAADGHGQGKVHSRSIERDSEAETKRGSHSGTHTVNCKSCAPAWSPTQTLFDKAQIHSWTARYVNVGELVYIPELGRRVSTETGFWLHPDSARPQWPCGAIVTPTTPNG